VPRGTARRERDPIAEVLTFRLLWHEVTVRASDIRAADALQAVVASAQHPMPVSRRMRYDADDSGAGYEICEEGDQLATVKIASEVRDVIYKRMHRRAFELASRMGWLRLHGALVDIGDERVLVSGPSGAGKTTLTVRLGLDGATVQGDESVLLRDGESLAVPRPFMLKPGIEHLIPELRGLRSLLPRIGDDAVLDPSVHFGGAWRLRVAPIGHVVLLDASPGPVTCTPRASSDVLPDLAKELLPVTETKPAMLRALTTLLLRGRAHRLRIGHPAAMRDALLEAIG
jgi:hypothetical protein